MGGTVSTIFTHQDLKLWEKGDIKELKVAGFVKEVSPPQSLGKKLRALVHC